MASQLFIKTSDVFSFGKYKDQKFSAVFNSNPEYINWGIKNNIIQLSHELENWINQDSSVAISKKPDSNNENVKSFVLDILSQKLLIDLISKTLDNGIEITNAEVQENTTSVGINPKALQFFEIAKVSFRKELLTDLLDKNMNELASKINVLFDFVSGQKTIIKDDKLIFVYEEVEEDGLLSIKVRFINNKVSYYSLEIIYNYSMLSDFYKFDVSIPFKLS